MAYISALWDGTLHANAFERSDANIYIIRIGYDSVEPLNYSLMVEMYPTDQGTEFAFAIVRSHRDTKVQEALFDSAVTNAIIPKSYRRKIREILFDTTERLVRSSNHGAFFMTTFCDNLPGKALEKYERLCEIFIRCGYDVVYSEPLAGSHFWQMNRRT